jgi:hypothetical protein
MKNSDSSLNELDIALRGIEQTLAEYETSRNRIIGQTEAVLADDHQTNGSLEALRLRLDAKEEQLRALQRELRQRDERILQLERLCMASDGSLDAARNKRLAAMGLVLESVSEPGVTHRITRTTTTIGRASGNDLVLKTISASRYHARLVVATDSTYLIDLNSTNGCSVNGERISRHMIVDGDIIAIGDAEFRFGVGVPLSATEDRSMDETHVMLDNSVIFVPAKAPKAGAARDLSHDLAIQDDVKKK